MNTALELPTTTTTIRVHGQETISEATSRITAHLASRFGITGVTITAHHEEHVVSWTSARGARITAYYKHLEGRWGLFTLANPHSGVLTDADALPPRGHRWEYAGGLTEEDLAALHALSGLM